MDINKLSIFLDTVDIGSMKKAAEKTNYTATGMFYLINSIEEELGIDLTTRDYRGISWNQAGKELEPYLRRLVETDHEVMEKIRELISNMSSHITVGAYPSIASLILPKVIHEFVDVNDEAEVTLRMANHNLLNLLNSGEIDLAVMRKEENDSDAYEWTHLMQLETYAAIPKSFLDHPYERISIDEFSQLPFLYSSSNPVNETLSRNASSEFRHRISVSTLDGLGTLLLVSQELGATAIMSLYKEICPENVLMIPFDPPVIHDYYVVQKVSDHMKPIAKEFISTLIEYCNKNYGNGSD